MGRHTSRGRIATGLALRREKTQRFAVEQDGDPEEHRVGDREAGDALG